ncbi:GntR family transcriptional regulator [Enterobacter huaxiensis]|jgi:DNA-binding GntR family transcriptional regulator|uniref:GntR family transcriptional regulator n=1 Tax=Enterobacter huaxiensis TaxID=2494702 RepID=A0A3R9Q3W3_9ENTR|nr:GntR family transcriptional regulator [Enterobacter huaxiensis]MEB7543006.1 GntR family transcriptional regulator [Enterobacter huaxiensis]MEB7582210.1 GntR family transcriptional regulator [Enterobacter huaxiensis]MEB7664593.1 GntR family transcriptional regulator [Enterobacter huaxiensis]RSK68079.1 GntR family transcriptional regulator [Enterobacter huaxiensis]UNC51749.1 GntR family transcriptional regulator [Enterobacter huaxiensis]
MSRSQNLRHNVINQVIDDMARGHVPSPLPSQSALAEMYNISRTTVRHILSHLSECGVLTQVGSDYVIARKPDNDDGFTCTYGSIAEQTRVFEHAFFAMINQRQLRAGETFSELQLARAAGVSPVVVREYLLKFGRYNLIQSEKRGQWSMKQFDQSWAEQLFELREMLETHALQHFLNLPDDDPRWLEAKTLLERHRTLRDSIGSSFRMFSQLDRDFHALLLSAAGNIFFNQSLEIISVIFHFHYQWDERDLKQRNIIAIDEHMTILSALICRSDLDATLALRNHLDTAKQSMIRSINQNQENVH